MSDKNLQADELDFDGTDDLEFDDKLEFDDPQPAQESKSSVKDFVGAATAALPEMIPFGGIADKAAAAAYATAGEGVDLVRGLLGSDKPSRDWVDRYEGFQKDEQQAREEAKSKSTAGTVAGTLAGLPVAVAAGPSIAAKMPGIAGVAARVGSGAAEAFVDQATRSADKTIDVDRGMDGATLAGGLGLALESIPVIGQGVKAAKRLIPGTENALPSVNRLAAKGAKLNPWNEMAEEDILELLNNTKLRRAARGTKVADSVSEARQAMKSAEDEIKGAVGTKFRDLEAQSLAESKDADIDALRQLSRELRDSRKKIKENPAFYPASVNERYKQTYQTLRGRGPDEFGSPTASVPPGKLESPEVAVKRVLAARRSLDDTIKNRDFSKLPKYEKEAILEQRALLQKYLQEKFAGSAKRAEADALYSEFKDATDGFFNQMKSRPAPKMAKDVDEAKLGAILNSGTGKGTKFDRQMDAINQWVKKAEPKIGELPEVKDAMKLIKEIRDKGEMNRIIGEANRIGGPTGAAVRAGAQLAGGYATGGMSFLLTPIIDPAAWTQVVDKIGAPAARKIQDAAAAIAKTDPALVARLMMLGRQPEDEKSEGVK